MWKIDKFLFGLNVVVAHSVSQREFSTYDECLRQCYIAENILKRVQDERERNRPACKDQGKASQYLKPRNSPLVKKPSFGIHAAQPPQCGKCKKRHHGECRMEKQQCFKCGSSSHFVKD